MPDAVSTLNSGLIVMFPDEKLPVTVNDVLSPFSEIDPIAPRPSSVKASNLPPSVNESDNATCGYKATPLNFKLSSS